MIELPDPSLLRTLCLLTSLWTLLLAFTYCPSPDLSGPDMAPSLLNLLAMPFSGLAGQHSGLPSSHSITLHYITLRYVTLHYIALQNSSLPITEIL